jgi:hypothetical protein
MFFKHSDAASAGQLNIRMRLAGTDATTATYFSQYIFGGVTTVSANQATSGTSARFASGNAGVAPVTIEMYSPFIAEATTFQARSIYTATSNPNIFVEAGSHNVATAYDGISFLPSATTMTGTLRIYGLRNA